MKDAELELKSGNLYLHAINSGTTINVCLPINEAFSPTSELILMGATSS
jgi:hypothetical protein